MAFRAAQLPPGAALSLGSLGALTLGALEEEEEDFEGGAGRVEVEAVGVGAAGAEVEGGEGMASRRWEGEDAAEYKSLGGVLVVGREGGGKENTNLSSNVERTSRSRSPLFCFSFF